MAAANNLMIKLSPKLQEALKLPTAAVDYFGILGIKRGANDNAAVDRAVMERSKELRKWQNSEQYGAEVVKLLPQLHRAAKILKDPARSQAYIAEVDRAERGVKESATDQFTVLARAALADGQLDAAGRQLLGNFAAEHGIPPNEAQRLLTQIRDEMEAQRAAAAAALAAGEAQAPAGEGKEEWEFRIGGEGTESFDLMLAGLEASGKFNETSPAKLIADAGRYDISPSEAKSLIDKFQRHRFHEMIRRVAASGAVRDAQVSLLAAKAPAYGLDPRQAYELIGEYTLSAHSPAEMFENYAAKDAMDEAEITKMIEEKGSAVRARRRNIFSSIGYSVPDWARNLVLIAIGGALLILVGNWAREKYASGKSGGAIVVTQATPTPGGGGTNPAVPQATPAAGTSTTVVAAATPVASPTPIADVDIPLDADTEDPASGMIKVEPQKAGDPPPFELAIAEVTNAQFDHFLRTTLSAAGTWRMTPGTDNLPATGITWAQAKAYCAWIASQQGWAADSVRMPTQAEFGRVAHARTSRGALTEPGYWDKARLNQVEHPAPVKSTQWDKAYVLGGGRVYDLLGNVAEWGMDEFAGKRAVLGGDYAQKNATFDPLVTRWAAPEAGSPTIGFRYVHVLAGGTT